ncbi:MAG: caspase family protein [Bacteroidota bacterium]
MGDPRKPKPKGPRPLETHDHRRYFVLLVGINEYLDPVPPLGGCVADVENLENYLTKEWLTGRADKDQTTDCDDPGIEGAEVDSYGPLHILKLTDKLATYKNIEKAFNLFLRQAHRTEKEGGEVIEDVAWFHFSGHGTEDFAAEGFKVLEPNGKDQAIVCYKEKKEDGYLLMKDKEIAVLLNYVSTVDPMGDKKKFGSPHIVVSLDCCHSGSGTRDFVMDETLKTRFAAIMDAKTRTSLASEDTTRELKDYANGFYASQEKLSVPITPHVALSGCESVQLAGDLPEGGVFSSGLIDALKATKGNLDYSDLYTRSRSFVQKRRGKDQTPQFDIVGDFNPYTKFLDGEPSKSPRKYELKFKDVWRVECGAVHGLPMNGEKKIKMSIQTIDTEPETLGIVEIDGVSAQHSTFSLPKDGSISLDTTTPENYRAIINYLPIPPTTVYVHGEEDGVKAMADAWDNSKSIQMETSLDGIGEAQIDVEVTKEEFIVRDTKHNINAIPEIIKRSRSTRNIENSVMADLGKMANWDRFIQLNNQDSQIADMIEFKIDYFGEDPANKLGTLTKSSVIEAKAGNVIMTDSAMYAYFRPTVVFKNVKQRLYPYLFHLRANYSIKSQEQVLPYNPDEFKGQDVSAIPKPVVTEDIGWGMPKSEDEVTCYFKLLVTTEELEYKILLQEELGGTRGDMVFARKPKIIENDWLALTYKVVLKKP